MAKRKGTKLDPETIKKRKEISDLQKDHNNNTDKTIILGQNVQSFREGLRYHRQNGVSEIKNPCENSTPKTTGDDSSYSESSYSESTDSNDGINMKKRVFVNENSANGLKGDAIESSLNGEGMR